MSIRPSPDLPGVAELAHQELRHGPETVIAILVDDRDLSLGLWSPAEPGLDVLMTLVGWTAPPEIDLIGVATDHGGQRRTTILDREGCVITVDGDGAVPRPTGLFTADLLARVFALPTPGPPVPVATWFDLRWLDRLAEDVFASERSLELTDLLAMHPLHRPGIDTPEELRDLVTDTADRCTWSALRQNSAGPLFPATHPPGGLALPHRDWFDDGSFARFLLAELAPPDQLLADLEVLLPVRLLAAIGAGLAGFGSHRWRPGQSL